MGIKISTVIIGARRFSEAIKLMDEGTKARVREAVSTTTMNVATRARTNVPVSTPADRKAKDRPGPGELRDTIRARMSTSGLTGYVDAGYGKLKRRVRGHSARSKKLLAKRHAAGRQMDLGIYAMVIEYGSPGRGIAASHYMGRAKEAEAPAHVARVSAALKAAADACAVSDGAAA